MHDGSGSDDAVQVADSADPWTADFDSPEARNADAAQSGQSAMQLSDELDGHHSSDEEDN
jgi:hypothetical protein